MMMLLMFLLLAFFSNINGSVQQQQQSDLRLVHYTGPKDNIIQLLAQNGFTYVREVKHLFSILFINVF